MFTSSFTRRKCTVAQNRLCSTLAPSMSFVLSSMSLHTYMNMHVFHETWLIVPKTHGRTPSDQLLFWWIRNNCLHKKKLLGKKYYASHEWNLFWDLNTTHYSKHLNESESSTEIPSWPNFTWNLIAFWLELPMLMMSATRDLPNFLSRQEKKNYLVNQRQILACWLEEDNVITLLPQQKQECTWASKTEVPCSSSSSVHKIHFTTYKVVQIHLPSSKETDWLLIQS